MPLISPFYKRMALLQFNCNISVLTFHAVRKQWNYEESMVTRRCQPTQQRVLNAANNLNKKI
jgi:hypothetical protein